MELHKWKLLNSKKLSIKLVFIITWNCTSENYLTAKNFQLIGQEKDTTFIQFNIEPNCYNAGKINDIGMSVYSDEVETLIPPYTACYVRRKEPGFFELDVAKDNKNVDFSMNATA